jgi:hypothetical protein
MKAKGSLLYPQEPTILTCDRITCTVEAMEDANEKVPHIAS